VARKARLVLGGLLVLAVTSGCGASGKHAAGSVGSAKLPTPVGSGYLGSGPSWVYFIEWTNAGGFVSGSTQVDKTSGDLPNEAVTSSTLSVDGTVTGSSIEVQFDRNLGLAPTDAAVLELTRRQ
jgi:hypothetical protein